MKKYILIVLLCFITIGCNFNNKTEIGADGYTYRLDYPEKKLSDGSTRVELWSRVKPFDTNNWYTPTLGSSVNTNGPKLFQFVSPK